MSYRQNKDVIGINSSSWYRIIFYFFKLDRTVQTQKLFISKFFKHDFGTKCMLLSAQPKFEKHSKTLLQTPMSVRSCKIYMKIWNSFQPDLHLNSSVVWNNIFTQLLIAFWTWIHFHFSFSVHSQSLFQTDPWKSEILLDWTQTCNIASLCITIHKFTTTFDFCHILVEMSKICVRSLMQTFSDSIEIKFIPTVLFADYKYIIHFVIAF